MRANGLPQTAINAVFPGLIEARMNADLTRQLVRKGSADQMTLQRRALKQRRRAA